MEGPVAKDKVKEKLEVDKLVVKGSRAHDLWEGLWS